MKNCIACGKELKDKRSFRCSYCDDKNRKIRYLGNKNPFYNKKHSKKTIGKLKKVHMNQIPYNFLGFIIKKKQLFNLYFNLNKTQLQISKILKCSQQCISNYLKKYNIPIRNQSTIMKKRLKNPKNHPNWVGGISKNGYSYIFNHIKNQIRKRDNYICQKCNKFGKHVHHIDYCKYNCKESNLITLCNKCNIKANYNRDYWYAYYKYIMENYIYAI